MVLTSDQNNRLLIYSFYDGKGIVDEFVLYCLQGMQKCVSQTVVVSNGPVDDAGKERLKDMGIQVLERDNEGLDIFGYKYGMAYYGWEKLQEFDEIILMNSTIAGPLYPFEEMFSEMDARDVDFWGITMHTGEDYDPWGVIPEGYIPPHLQSYFLGVRRQMLSSEAFHEYWDNMSLFSSYQEAVGQHEVIFTKKFSDLGYVWDAYVPSEDLKDLTSYPLMFMPEVMIEERKCPIFKRKSLLLAPDDLLGSSYGDLNSRLLACLERVGYDRNLILPNIVRTVNAADACRALNEIYIQSDKLPAPIGKTQPKTLVAAKIANETVWKLVLPYLERLKSSCELLLFTNEEMQGRVKDTTGIRVEVYESEAAILQNLCAQAKEVDYICYLGFFNHCSVKFYELGKMELFRFCLDSLAATPVLLQNHIALLEEHSYLGLVSPMSPVHAHYLNSAELLWNQVRGDVKKLLKQCGVSVPAPNASTPFAPHSSFFLAKAGLLKASGLPDFLERWQKLKEPKLAIVNESIPFLLQQTGHLTAYVASENTARSHLLVQQYRLWQSVESYGANEQGTSNQYVRCNSSLYVDAGDGFSEDTRMTEFVMIRQGGAYSVKFVLKQDAKAVRFDPEDGVGFLASGMKAKLNGFTIKAAPTNGYRFGDQDIFVSTDPQYVFAGPFAKGSVLTVKFRRAVLYNNLDFLPERTFAPEYRFGKELGISVQAAWEWANSQQKRKDRLRRGPWWKNTWLWRAARRLRDKLQKR